MNRIDQCVKKSEIESTVNFLKATGSRQTNWVMCYPYGAYNNSLINILKNRSCLIGLAMNLEVADIKMHDIMALPRMRTNDFPPFAMT